MESSERDTHLKFMREALAMAEYALNHAETPVGCIFVHQPTGVILGRGYNHTNHTFNGTRHAEFVAVNYILSSPVASIFSTTSVSSTSTSVTSTSSSSIPSSSSIEKYVKNGKLTTEIFKECDLYVTVEPCIMCASFLRQLGIQRVFFGASNEKFGGTGGVLNIQCANGRYDSFPEKREEDEIPRVLGSEEEEGEGKMDRAGDGNGNDRERWDWAQGDYEVSGGWLREDAIVMLRRFYVQENGRAPEEKRGKEGRVLRLDVEPLGGV